MYQRALQGKEKAWGPEHMSTLSTFNNLGILYAKQSRLAKAECYGCAYAHTGAIIGSWRIVGVQVPACDDSTPPRGAGCQPMLSGV
ncbi:uncharacterized protein K444DRAFT_395716 [Hyaloscypha bicolor E]|uniref:Uncharacterized protein n=1 Tax=Hyaloscypha bicolor E TaxID=1095630 RepID=A0A2J6TAS0_9HELO|nr:uncharacterized protein K444DRAFT_395716 [Hyaloscypha bicolor E]PMD60068.1 hypothetical protein K444DRAFT_395716 [Hyaloscypha bicolor E]